MNSIRILLFVSIFYHSSASEYPPNVNPNVYNQQYQPPSHQYQQQPQYQQPTPQPQYQQPPQQYQQPQYQQPPQQHQQPQYQQPPQQQPPQQQFQQPQQHQQPNGVKRENVMRPELSKEKRHMQEHEEALDMEKMSQEELQFHYFKMHDTDGNNKLDGIELTKSLLHWHEANKDKDKEGKDGHEEHEPKIFGDDELIGMIDPIMQKDDKNGDGMIGYDEFVLAQNAANAASANEKDAPK